MLIKMPWMRSPSLPRAVFTCASSAIVDGQTSGHCVKPKNTTTTLPLKSASVRTRPVEASGNAKSRAYSAPVMSTAWKAVAGVAGMKRSQPASHPPASDNGRVRINSLRRPFTPQRAVTVTAAA